MHAMLYRNVASSMLYNLTSSAGSSMSWWNLSVLSYSAKCVAPIEVFRTSKLRDPLLLPSEKFI
jgi:hypothetical protein